VHKGKLLIWLKLTCLIYQICLSESRDNAAKETGEIRESIGKKGMTAVWLLFSAGSDIIFR
jgi:hypothetical protein